MREPISEQELKKRIEKIAPLVKGFGLIPDHVVITDENANILYANKGVEQNTGFFVNEIIGKTPGDLWGGKMPKEFYENLWHTIKIEKKPFVGEVRNVKKDGTEYWQELHISPILDDAGKVEFFIGIEPNIADRKRKEQFREKFLSIVSHQLRNPLTTMQWILELLLKNKKLGKDVRGKIKNVHERSRELSDVITHLLTLSRAEKNQMDKNKEVIDIVEVVESIIDEVHTHNPNVKFSFHHIKNVLLSINKIFATQIFSNIIYNAAEYADKTVGKVDIKIKKTDENGYLFSCSNNGPGIAPEDKPYIFTKLFRAPSAVKTKKSGTGLGLFIVKTIANDLGWQVWFESEIGKGATFYVEIPVKKTRKREEH